VTAAVEAFERAESAPVYRVDHVADGDTIALRNGQRVRLVQIDTPEIYFGTRVLRPAGVADDRAVATTGLSRAPVRRTRDRSRPSTGARLARTLGFARGQKADECHEETDVSA
jgi:endonuclease YncB( thermonuclease family)